MKNWGIVLIVIGVLIATIALFIMSSTVSTENMRSLSDYGGMIGTGTYSEIHNLPRAQLRDMVFQAGCVAFIGGVVLLVGGLLDERLSALSHSRAEETNTAVVADLSSEAGQVASAPVPDSGPVGTYYGQPVNRSYSDPQAAAEEGERNKEIMAWAFGGICVVGGLVALVLLAS